MNNNHLLDTSNQHCYVYTNDDLRIEVLGGARVDSLDRMRVSVKITLLDERVNTGRIYRRISDCRKKQEGNVY